ncbi:hypothetical protein SLEP1_g39835 [Rubroshorea leprosula]|uniref:Uncharacterized protein n=1 Tax=Rubroshorea leprosula TaxID=152421 RepID=A0AAV5L1W3_9ROSI|nr:hypothetical protein SLEP1_g39835 [Rubroshorea leprosula]
MLPCSCKLLSGPYELIKYLGSDEYILPTIAKRNL